MLSPKYRPQAIGVTAKTNVLNADFNQWAPSNYSVCIMNGFQPMSTERVHVKHSEFRLLNILVKRHFMDTIFFYYITL